MIDYDTLEAQLRLDGEPAGLAHRAADAVRDLRAELAARDTRIAEALALHRPIRNYTSGSTDPKHVPSYETRCGVCGSLYPCPTVATLSLSRVSQGVAEPSDGFALDVGRAKDWNAPAEPWIRVRLDRGQE